MISNNGKGYKEPFDCFFWGVVITIICSMGLGKGVIIGLILGFIITCVYTCYQIDRRDKKRKYVKQLHEERSKDVFRQTVKRQNYNMYGSSKSNTKGYYIQQLKRRYMKKMREADMSETEIQLVFDTIADSLIYRDYVTINKIENKFEAFSKTKTSLLQSGLVDIIILNAGRTGIPWCIYKRNREVIFCINDLIDF